MRADVESIDGIIRAYHEVISGPAGAKHGISRDESLYHPDAQIIVVKRDSGRAVAHKMTLQALHRLSAPFFPQRIYENEIHRLQELFGAIAHVWSTFETRTAPQGEVRNRGINSIQLFRDGERYWITSWIYDAERPDHPVPVKYPSKNERGC